MTISEHFSSSLVVNIDLGHTLLQKGTQLQMLYLVGTIVTVHSDEERLQDMWLVKKRLHAPVMLPTNLDMIAHIGLPVFQPLLSDGHSDT